MNTKLQTKVEAAAMLYFVLGYSVSEVAEVLKTSERWIHYLLDLYRKNAGRGTSLATLA